jgi:hypothetical protein
MTGITIDTPAGGSNDNAPANVSNARVAPTASNPRGYPPFDLRFIPTYTNNQIRYYHTSGAMLGVDQDAFKTKMDERKASLEIVNWDGDSRPNPPPAPTPSSRTLSYDEDSEPDF